MIVYVAFKFDGVKPDSERADEIVREITESCETMQITEGQPNKTFQGGVK
jgi:hypothetical protein